MKKTIFSNSGLKIAAVLVSFLIWLMVTNGSDPEVVSYISGVKITQKNVESVVAADKVFRITGTDKDRQTVDIRVKGRRSVVDSLKASDFKVVANMKNLTFMDTIPLEVECLNPAISKKNISCEPAALQVEIEDKKEVTFAVGITTAGKPVSGYEVGTVRIQTGDTILIAGAASLVDIIDKVQVVVNTSGMSKDENVDAAIKIIDKNGDQFSEAQMASLELKTTAGVLLKEEKLTASVDLWEVRDGILLDVKTTGTPRDGYRVASVTTTPETISLAGTETILKELNGKLELPGAISVQGVSESFEQSIDLSEYLQENYKRTLRQEADAVEKITVKVQIEKLGTTKLELPISDITIQNKPAGFDMVLTPTDKLTIEVRSYSSSADPIKVSDVKAVLDLSDYQKPGNYTVPVDISLPAGFAIADEVTITVNLEEAADALGLAETTGEE